MKGKSVHGILCVIFTLALLFIVPGIPSAQVSVTNTFSSGSAANAADVNQNFSDVTDGLNTHMSDVGAHSDTDTLAGLGCAADEVAKWDGAAWACAGDQDTWLSEATVDSYADNNGYLSTSAAAATYQPKPTRIFMVGPVGADDSTGHAQNGMALLNAYNAISGSSTNPALLKIEPGTYDLGGSFMAAKSYVSIQGSGKYATIIKSSSSIFWAVSSTSISDLTIEANAASMASGLNLGVGSEARNLNVKAISSAGIATAVETGSDSRLINVDITATGFTQSNGVLAFGIATFHGVNITANGGNVNTGLKGSMSNTSTGNRISIPNGSVRIGVENGSVHGSYISALGGVAVKWTSPYQIVNSTLLGDTGLLADFSAVWCVNCNGTVDRTFINSSTLSIDFSTTAINNSGLHVGSSRLSQPVTFGINTTLVCVYNYDGATYTARDAQCQ